MNLSQLATEFIIVLLLPCRFDTATPRDSTCLALPYFLQEFTLCLAHAVRRIPSTCSKIVTKTTLSIFKVQATIGK